MTTSTNPIKRVEKVIDLINFTTLIDEELAKHIRFNLNETRSPFFYPAIFQLLANEMSYYKKNVYCLRRYETKVFRAAYLYEDRCEIIDELQCKLSEYLTMAVHKDCFKYGVRISFVTHNQWIVSYVE